MCASVCECVQGVSWEAITRAKIWLVFQTASFGVAAGPKNTPPTDIHPVLYSWQSNPEKRVKLQHTFKQQLSRNSVNLNAFFTPPCGIIPWLFAMHPHFCACVSASIAVYSFLPLFRFCSPLTHVPLANSFLPWPADKCVYVCEFLHPGANYYHNSCQSAIFTNKKILLWILIDYIISYKCVWWGIT